jgi:hypothetical protein
MTTSCDNNVREKSFQHFHNYHRYDFIEGISSRDGPEFLNIFGIVFFGGNYNYEYIVMVQSTYSNNLDYSITFTRSSIKS